VAADVKRPWKSDPAKFNRVLTVVDQESGRTEELDVHYTVNGELDGLLHKLAVLRLGTSKKWPRNVPEGTINRPYTETVVLGGFPVADAA
jgi:hypothetical protein